MGTGPLACLSMAQQFRVPQFDLTSAPAAEDIRLRPPRLTIPAALLPICTTEHYERLLHSYGSSFPDSVRVFARDFSNPPDVIAYPRHAQDILALLDWCHDAGAAVIPFGGGTSVVGGVEPPRDSPAVVTVDMQRMEPGAGNRSRLSNGPRSGGHLRP